MRAFLGVLLIVLACGSYLRAAGPTAKSLWANNDVELDTHPSPFWRAAAPLYKETDTYGHRDPKYRTELRTRWTKQNLYFLFICP